MDKIKELLKALGASPEFSQEFTTLVEEHISKSISKEKNRLQEDLDKKLEKIKKVCTEEVENEKIKLARGVQRYLESITESVKRAASKQLANEETESINKLKTITALVNGINVDEAKANQDLQAALGECKALKEQLAESKTANASAIAKVNKLKAISEKLIERQRSLEKEIKESKESSKQTVVKNSTEIQKSIKTMNESRVAKTQPVTDVAKQSTITEKTDTEIDQIASQIDV